MFRLQHVLRQRSHTPRIHRKSLTVQVICGSRSFKMRKVLDDPFITVEDWLFDFLSKDVPPEWMEGWLDEGHSDAATPRAQNTTPRSVELSLGARRSINIADADTNQGTFADKAEPGERKTVRVEVLLEYKPSSLARLPPQRSIFPMVHSGEKIVLRLAGDGRWKFLDEVIPSTAIPKTIAIPANPVSKCTGFSRGAPSRLQPHHETTKQTKKRLYEKAADPTATDKTEGQRTLPKRKRTKRQFSQGSTRTASTPANNTKATDPNAPFVETPSQPLRSFYIPPEDAPTKARKLALEWCQTELMEIYESSIVPIVPFTNTVRMNHQSPQALRLFFSAQNEVVGNSIAERWIYGPKAVLRTTGFHPSKGFKVRPFSERLKALAELLAEDVKGRLAPKSVHHTNNLFFKFLEIKIYQGPDVYHDKTTGKPLVDDWNRDIRDDCNQRVGLHNDLNFSDAGIQNPDDTAEGCHPIVTLSIGSPRKLTFVHKTKTHTRWKRDPPSTDNHFWLKHGSMFVLLPDDEIPSATGTSLHKTQHKARFSGSGISVAFVFRSVRAKSFFDIRTHKWMWKKDVRYKKYVRCHLKRIKKRYKQAKVVYKGAIPREIAGMSANINQFLDNLV